eukprot:s279_g4.t2
MIAPSLLDHVKQEVEKMPNCQKIFGKAREERDLARKKGGETPAGHRLRGPGVIRRRLQELPFSLGTHVVCPGTFLLCRCQMSRSLVALAQCRLERNWHQASLVADCVRILAYHLELQTWKRAKLALRKAWSKILAQNSFMASGIPFGFWFLPPLDISSTSSSSSTGAFLALPGFDCLAARAAAAFWTFALFGEGFNLLGSIDSAYALAPGCCPQADVWLDWLDSYTM